VRIILKWINKDWIVRYVLSWLMIGPVVGYYEYGNETFASIKRWETFEKVRDWRFLKKDSAP
jgi:hypothetical protein